MASRDEELRLRLTAQDDASKTLDKVAGKVEGLEGDDVSIPITATDRASAVIADVETRLAGLSSEDKAIVLRAQSREFVRAIASARKELKDFHDLSDEEVDLRVRVIEENTKALDTIQAQVRDLDGERVTVTADVRGFDKLDQVTTRLPGNIGAAAGALKGLATGTAGIGAGVAAGAAGMFALANNAADAARNVNLLSQLTGASAEEASRLSILWEQTGADVKDLQDVILQMSGVIATQPELLAQVGAEIQKNKDGTVDLAATFLNVVEATRDLPSSLENAALKSQLFGEEGVRQVNALTTSFADLGTAMAAVPEASVTTQENIEDAKEFDAQMRELTLKLSTFAQTIGVKVVPGLAAMADGLNNLLDGPAGQALDVLIAGAEALGVVLQNTFDWDAFGFQVPTGAKALEDTLTVLGDLSVDAYEKMLLASNPNVDFGPWREQVAQAELQAQALGYANLAAAQAAGDLRVQQFDVASAIALAGGNADAAATSTGTYAKEQEKATRTTDLFAEALQKLDAVDVPQIGDVLKPGDLTRINVGAKRVGDAFVDLDDAFKALKEANLPLELSNIALATGDFSEAQGDAADALFSAGDAARGYLRDLIEGGAAQGQVVESAKALREELENNLVKTLGISREKAKGLVDELGGLEDKDIELAFQVKMQADAAAQLALIQSAIAGLDPETQLLIALQITAGDFTGALESARTGIQRKFDEQPFAVKMETVVGAQQFIADWKADFGDQPIDFPTVLDPPGTKQFDDTVRTAKDDAEEAILIPVTGNTDPFSIAVQTARNIADDPLGISVYLERNSGVNLRNAILGFAPDTLAVGAAAAPSTVIVNMPPGSNGADVVRAQKRYLRRNGGLATRGALR